MNALRITKAHLGAVLAVCLVLCAVGVWVFFAGMKKNGFESLPLIWYLVLVLGPVIAFGCFVAMWRARQGSQWWLPLGVLLLLPQLLVWYFAVGGVLHYLGWIR